jgi:hypothetical protein
MNGSAYVRHVGSGATRQELDAAALGLCVRKKLTARSPTAILEDQPAIIEPVVGHEALSKPEAMDIYSDAKLTTGISAWSMRADSRSNPLNRTVLLSMLSGGDGEPDHF